MYLSADGYANSIPLMLLKVELAVNCPRNQMCLTAISILLREAKSSDRFNDNIPFPFSFLQNQPKKQGEELQPVSQLRITLSFDCINGPIPSKACILDCSCRRIRFD